MQEGLRAMEMRIEELSAQYIIARKRKGRTLEEQQRLCDVTRDLVCMDAALARCPLMTEAFIRKVYLEKRSLEPLPRGQQKRLKKAGLKQFFDCFCE